MDFSSDKTTFFDISNVLEIEGSLYCIKSNNAEGSYFNLYAEENGKISNKPIIKYINKVITSYCNNIYYLDTMNKLQKYNLLTKTKETIIDKEVKKNSIYVYGLRVFFLATITYQTHELHELNLNTGTIKTIIKNVTEIVSFNVNKITYKIFNDRTCEKGFSELFNVINIDTYDIVEFGAKEVSIEGFINNCVIYTQVSPNEFNKNLYIKSFDADKSEKTIEQNIYKFCDIIDNKLFYYVGNSKNQSLISISYDGSGRKEYPYYADKIMFEQNGWLYCIIKVQEKSMLCKFCLNGSELGVVDEDIKKFVCVKSGYIYYINGVSTLVKVCIEDDDKKEICCDVGKVLYVDKDKIIYISNDDKIKLNEYSQEIKIVQSMYSNEFSDSGKIKLVYDIKNAKMRDENTVYYIAPSEIKASYDKLCDREEVLYKLDVKTNKSTCLMSLKFEEKNEGGCYIATCVYGSYDCPEVWTLRRFRDNTLAQTIAGKTFIYTYYAISPTLVKWFGNSMWFKRMWKSALDKIVDKLQGNGVEDTPYQDKKQ